MGLGSVTLLKMSTTIAWWRSDQAHQVEDQAAEGVDDVEPTDQAMNQVPGRRRRQRSSSGAAIHWR
jgi:hypothetical protein